MKKSMERKISELEEELRSSEERLKKIEEYEREDYLYPVVALNSALRFIPPGRRQTLTQRGMAVKSMSSPGSIQE